MIALDRLGVITPFEIALANKALATSLQQVAGIVNLSLPQYAATVAFQQTTQDLPLITAQTSVISSETVGNLLGLLATGTGPEGTITIMDVLGTEAGATEPQLTNAVATINTMNVVYLTSVYQTMVNVLNGDYAVPPDPPPDPPVPPGPPNPNDPVDIPSGTPGGPETYANMDEAILALIDIANNEVGNLIVTYSAPTTTLNTDFNAIASHVRMEQTNQAKAQIDFANLTPNSQSILSSFALSLPQYGVNAAPDGSAQFLSATADTTILGGQAILATLRQGSNEVALNASGIQTTTHIPL